MEGDTGKIPTQRTAVGFLWGLITPRVQVGPAAPCGVGLNGHPLLPAVACPQGDEHFCLRKIIIIIN